MTIEAVVCAWRIALEAAKVSVVDDASWLDAYHAGDMPQEVWRAGGSVAFEVANDAWFHLRHEP